jgi:Metalloenzyme superfamily
MRWALHFEQRNRRWYRPAVVLVGVLAGVGPFVDRAAPAAQSTAGGRQVVLVTLDGARWQEVFGGLDLAVLRSTSDKTPVEKTPSYARYWAETPEARREKLMPFLWTTLASRHGVLAGNRAHGSRVTVTNRHRFSYPGYNELLTGAAHDDVVTTNDNRRYDYLTVLEWLRPTLGLTRDGVAVFGSWETFNWIAERSEGTIAIDAGFEAVDTDDPRIAQLSALQFDTPTPWSGARHDVYTHRFAMAHLARYRPRVLYVAFDETDDWAHDGRYDLTLEALNRTDARIGELWTWLQADPVYRDRTTLIVTVDHGRGRTAKDWTSHGSDVPGAEEMWLGCFGPSVRTRGEARGHAPIEQRQVAATVAASVSEDFRTVVPGAASPISICGET